MIIFPKSKILLLFFGLFIAACSNSNLATQTPQMPETKGGAIVVTPTPFLGQKATIRGENSLLKLAENFERSIKQQEQPNIWLEFHKENGEKMEVPLDPKIKEESDSAWKAMLNYRYVKRYSKNPNEIYQSVYDIDTKSIMFRNELHKLEIDSLDGARRMSEDEIKDIFSVQIELMIDRFVELERHFNP